MPVREEGKIPLWLAEFLTSKSRPIGYWPFLSQGQLLVFVCFFLCSENLAWQLSVLGYQKYGPTEIWAVLQFATEALLTVTSSQHCWVSLTFLGLSLGVVVDLGSIVSFAPSLRTPLGSIKLFNTARNIYYLSKLKPNKIFGRIFKVVLWWKVGQTESWYLEPDKNFFKGLFS